MIMQHTATPPAFLDFVRLLVEKVIVSPNDLEVRLRANGIERLVLELRPEPVEQQEEALA
jgi:site-specific DNA recombinase